MPAMRPLVFAALTAALSGCQPSGTPGAAPTASGPLAPLVPVTQQLERSMTAFLAGDELPAAFAPLPIDGYDAASAGELRSKLKAAGVTRAAHPTMEFELVYAEGGRDVYYLRTNLIASDGELHFLAIEGRAPDGGKVGVTSHPIADYGGPAQPFRDAAEALVATLRGDGCRDLALADPGEVARIITVEGPRKQIVDILERSRQNLPALCATVAALKPEQVRLRIDDQSLVAYGDDGATRGIIKGDFAFQPPGALAVGIKGFRPLAP
jgi:hypothetical protein